MKTTIYNVLKKRENETIINNAVRFELDNGDFLIVENRGDCIDIKSTPKRGFGQMYVKPKVSNRIEVTTDL